MREKSGRCRQRDTPDDTDLRSPLAAPEACEHDQQAQEPTPKLCRRLDFLAGRAGARKLAKPSRECPPGEPYQEQHCASQKTTPDDRPETTGTPSYQFHLSAGSATLETAARPVVLGPGITSAEREPWANSKCAGTFSRISRQMLCPSRQSVGSTVMVVASEPIRYTHPSSE